MGLSERDKNIIVTEPCLIFRHFNLYKRMLFCSLFKQGFDNNTCSFAAVRCFSFTVTFILLPSPCSLPVWPFRLVIFKSSRQSPPPTFLLLVYICQTEPQQEENGTMIHQQQERPKKEKQHVKHRWDVIQFHQASTAHQN